MVAVGLLYLGGVGFECIIVGWEADVVELLFALLCGLRVVPVPMCV
jgi:hypothetical protein